jgi:hypothetical protein
MSRPGFTSAGVDVGPKSPGRPGSPPARRAISIATCQQSSIEPACTPVVLMLVVWRSPRCRPPWVGFSASVPQ